jgi:hypothetical protein
MNVISQGMGREVQYYQGQKELPILAAVSEILVFPKQIKRPKSDSPIAITALAPRARNVGPLRKIKWVLVDRVGKGQSEFKDAIVLEDMSVAWGRHFRNGDELEYGKVTMIEDGDLLQAELPGEGPEISKPKEGHVNGGGMYASWKLRKICLDFEGQKCEAMGPGRKGSQTLVEVPEAP